MRARRFEPTFRERAAIAFAAAPWEPDVLWDKEAVQAADSLAKEACEQWGHDWSWASERRTGAEPPDREEPSACWVCDRCGLVAK